MRRKSRGSVTECFIPSSPHIVPQRVTSEPVPDVVGIAIKGSGFISSKAPCLPGDGFPTLLREADNHAGECRLTRIDHTAAAERDHDLNIG